jgi:hypothetical protein
MISEAKTAVTGITGVENEHFHGTRLDRFAESELPRNQLPEITLK